MTGFLCHCSPELCDGNAVESCDTVCAAKPAVPDDPNSGIFLYCFSGNKPPFAVRANCDNQQLDAAFCCYPNDSRNSTELCNTEEAFRNSTETPTMEPPTNITVDPTMPAQIATTTTVAVTVNISAGMSTVFVVTKQCDHLLVLFVVIR